MKMRYLTNARTRSAQVLSAALLAMAAPFAFAAGESTGIISAFNEYKVEVLLIVVAFAVVLWSKRGGKLLNP